MTKAVLRKKYKALRTSLAPDAVTVMSLKIANQLLQCPIWDNNCYHLYLTMEHQKEVDTHFIFLILQGKDKEITISKSCFENNTLTHYRYMETTILKKNSYGIPEPVAGTEISVSEIDVVFVPLLGFDLMGNRVGYGKGFYDKFLAECKATTLKIGLSFFEAEQQGIAISDTDIALDYCVTPEKVYTFSSPL